MTDTITPQKTNLGWVIELPTEIARALGVAEGSLALLHPKNGSLDVEILPPPSPELKEEVRRITEKYQDTFEELKRLGD